MPPHLPQIVIIHEGPFAGQTGVLEGLERRGGVRVRVNEVCRIRVDASELRAAVAHHTKQPYPVALSPSQRGCRNAG